MAWKVFLRAGKPALKELGALVEVLEAGLDSGHGVHIIAQDAPRAKAAFLSHESHPTKSHEGGPKLILRSTTLLPLLALGADPTRVGWGHRAQRARRWLGPGPLLDIYPGRVEEAETKTDHPRAEEDVRRVWISPAECRMLLPKAREDVLVALRPLQVALESVKVRRERFSFDRLRLRGQKRDVVGGGGVEKGDDRLLVLRRMWLGWRRYHHRRRRYEALAVSLDEVERWSALRSGYERLLAHLRERRRQRLALLHGFWVVWAARAKERARQRRIVRRLILGKRRVLLRDAWRCWRRFRPVHKVGWDEVRPLVWGRIVLHRWRRRGEAQREERERRGEELYDTLQWRHAHGYFRAWHCRTKLLGALRIGVKRGAFLKWRDILHHPLPSPPTPPPTPLPTPPRPTPDEIPSVLRPFCADIGFPPQNTVAEWRRRVAVGEEREREEGVEREVEEVERERVGVEVEGGGKGGLEKEVGREEERKEEEGGGRGGGGSGGGGRSGVDGSGLEGDGAFWRRAQVAHAGSRIGHVVRLRGAAARKRLVPSRAVVVREGDEAAQLWSAHVSIAERIGAEAASHRFASGATNLRSSASRVLHQALPPPAPPSHQSTRPHLSAKDRRRARERAAAKAASDEARAAVAVAGNWGFESHVPGKFAGRIEHALRRLEEAKSLLHQVGSDAKGSFGIRPRDTSKEDPWEQPPTIARRTKPYHTLATRFAKPSRPQFWNSKEYTS